LPIDRAPRRLELVFQFVVFAPQPLPLGFAAPEILAQLLILAPQSLDLGRVGRRGSGSR
jgi:hypothetical protein